MKRLAGLLLLLMLSGCAAQPKETVTVLADGARYSSPQCSPDGSQVVVGRSTRQGETVVAYDMQGGLTAEYDSPGGLISPAWIEGQVAFGIRSKGSVQYVQATPDGLHEIARIDGIAQFSGSENGDLFAVSISQPSTGESALWLLDVTSGRRSLVWDEGVPVRETISPTGDKVVFTTPKGKELYLLDLQTRKAEVLWTIDAGALSGFTWTPDGQFVGVRRTHGQSGFYLVDVTGQSTPERLTTLDLASPDWCAQGDRIVFVSVGSPGRNELRLLQLPPDWAEKVGSAQGAKP